MNWTPYIVPIASAITVVAIAVADIITHRRTSAKFDRIRTEEMNLKDEQIKTMKSKYEGILAIKDELIINIKELSPHKVKEAFDSLSVMLDRYNEELKKENYELNQALNDARAKIDELEDDLSEAKTQPTYPEFTELTGEISDSLSRAISIQSSTSVKQASFTSTFRNTLDSSLLTFSGETPKLVVKDGQLVFEGNQGIEFVPQHDGESNDDLEWWRSDRESTKDQDESDNDESDGSNDELAAIV